MVVIVYRSRSYLDSARMERMTGLALESSL